MRIVKPRSIKELANDQIMDNMYVQWKIISIGDEPILTLTNPATKRDVWMYEHVSVVIRNFMETMHNYYTIKTSHRTKIDLTIAMHKDLKRLLRKMHKHYPVEFGYALKAPCDMHDQEMAKRVALERLIKKIKGAV